MSEYKYTIEVTYMGKALPISFETLDELNDSMANYDKINELIAEVNKLKADNKQLRAALEAAMIRQGVCPKCIKPRLGMVWDSGGALLDNGKIKHTNDCIIGNTMKAIP